MNRLCYCNETNTHKPPVESESLRGAGGEGNGKDWPLVPGDTAPSVLTLSLLVVRSYWKVYKMLLSLLLWKLTKNRMFT